MENSQKFMLTLELWTFGRVAFKFTFHRSTVCASCLFQRIYEYSLPLTTEVFPIIFAHARRADISFYVISTQKENNNWLTRMIRTLRGLFVGGLLLLSLIIKSVPSILGRETWSSDYGRKIMVVGSNRSMFEKTKSKQKWGRGWPN